MSNEVDYYDVQALIREARSTISAEIQAAVSDVRELLRSELRDEINALQRVLDARTERQV